MPDVVVVSTLALLHNQLGVKQYEAIEQEQASVQLNLHGIVVKIVIMPKKIMYVTSTLKNKRAYLFPWQSVVEITTTVTNRYDELDEVVCELLPDKQTVV